MLLKTEAELIEIKKRALKILDWMDAELARFLKTQGDRYPARDPDEELEMAVQFREDFHYLLDIARRLAVFAVRFLSQSRESRRVGGLPSASNLSEARPPRSLL